MIEYRILCKCFFSSANISIPVWDSREVGKQGRRSGGKRSSLITSLAIVVMGNGNGG